MESNDLWPIIEVSEREAVNIIISKQPLGKFWRLGVTGYLGIDNRLGKARNAVFETELELIEYLNSREL